jgi:hypothetical protein
MQKYVRDWLQATGYSPEEIIGCARCGKQDYVINMELHHKVFRSQGGSDEPENLEPLCHDCHFKIHNG